MSLFYLISGLTGHGDIPAHQIIISPAQGQTLSIGEDAHFTCMVTESNQIDALRPHWIGPNGTDIGEKTTGRFLAYTQDGSVQETESRFWVYTQIKLITENQIDTNKANVFELSRPEKEMDFSTSRTSQKRDISK